jgi:ankyrin repeat protein
MVASTAEASSTVAASPPSVHSLNHKGCSAAHWAASGGDLDVCRALAEIHGVDFATANSEGNTPLTKAIEHGREPVVEWLLTSGRCEQAVAKAAGYAARLAARHSADESTNEISELMQSYLLAQYYLRLQLHNGSGEVGGSA